MKNDDLQTCYLDGEQFSLNEGAIFSKLAVAVQRIIRVKHPKIKPTIKKLIN